MTRNPHPPLSKEWAAWNGGWQAGFNDCAEVDDKSVAQSPPSVWWECLRCFREFKDCKCDSDGTATAADCEDNPVPQDCQARAESIAQSPSSEQPQ